ncbi:MAG TPA: branched-chain amino acid ABC transporter permease, partial [Anaerolineae bacterium]|nr:branched-chain amino acid ABC transporter permease [Anaerolineae bacterium]
SILTVWLFADDKIFGPPVLPASWAIPLFPVILIIGAIAASLAGLLVAIPSFRTRGDYLAIITLAVNYIVKSAIENMEVIGGPRGFVGMKRVMNNMAAVFDAPWLLIWTFIGMLATIFIIRNFMSSTFGKGIEAIREDEIAAELMSVNTRRLKVIAFMLSCGLAGLAGGLFAHGPGGYINPGTFTILKSTEVMVMVYLGGMGSISGSIISAIGFTLLLELLRPLGTYKWVVIPLLLVVMMLFRPSGILGNKELTDVFPKLRAIFGAEEENYAHAAN